MSTGRRWDKTSCMRLGTPQNNFDEGALNEIVAKDIAEGTLVAYAVRAGDDQKEIQIRGIKRQGGDFNIEKPISRLLIKPFHAMSGSRQVLFRIETKEYGTPVPGFRETVQKWLDKVNKGVSHGHYKMKSTLYNDGMGTEVYYTGYDTFKNDDARVAFLNSIEYSRISTRIMKGDPRWVNLIMQMQSMTVDSLKRILQSAETAGVPADMIGKALDKSILDEYVPKIYDYLWEEGDLNVIKNSKVLMKVGRERYAYKKTMNASEYTIRRGLFVDSRWINAIKDRGSDSSGIIADRLLDGEIAIDRWLAKPQSELAKSVLRVLQFGLVAVRKAKPTELSRRIIKGWLEKREDLLAAGIEENGTIGEDLEAAKSFLSEYWVYFRGSETCTTNLILADPQWIVLAGDTGKPVFFDVLFKDNVYQKIKAVNDSELLNEIFISISTNISSNDIEHTQVPEAYEERMRQYMDIARAHPEYELENFVAHLEKQLARNKGDSK
jgi:hypothetical protein